MKMSEIVALAKNLINRQKELQDKGVKVIKQDGYVKFYYDLLKDPDFGDPEVALCRGITFRDGKIVCCPFFKFGNYGEYYAADIDWASARVLEKMDGSLITLWFDQGKWNVSTSKTVDAFSCAPQLGSTSFGGLFAMGAARAHLDLDILNPKYTYMFELTSPYNKVVIPYDTTEVWHIGTRDNETLQELDVDIGVQKPKQYNLSSLEECIEAVATFGSEKEGFVVVDKNYNRIKIKSQNYFMLHKLANNGAISKEEVVRLLLDHEETEYLSYFPEKEEVFKEYKDKLNALITKVADEWYETLQQLQKAETPKEKAIIIQNTLSLPDYGFKRLKKRVTVENYLRSLPTSRVIKYLEDK